ncbi:MAG: hypothetical protein D6715_01875 [Calditrichaeota bacterium]|nr:MAG: hypothetical protein D6715_01875 [Calditrichota bacterium]
MAKRQDFASKIQKGKNTGPTCPQCGDTYQMVKVVRSVYSEEKGSWKYQTKNVKVCSCNQAEVYA